MISQIEFVICGVVFPWGAKITHKCSKTDLPRQNLYRQEF